jgi:hypothetical protein
VRFEHAHDLSRRLRVACEIRILVCFTTCRTRLTMVSAS